MSARFKSFEQMTHDEQVERVRDWIRHYESMVDHHKRKLAEATVDLWEHELWLQRLNGGDAAKGGE